MGLHFCGIVCWAVVGFIRRRTGRFVDNEIETAIITAQDQPFMHAPDAIVAACYAWEERNPCPVRMHAGRHARLLPSRFSGNTAMHAAT